MQIEPQPTIADLFEHLAAQAPERLLVTHDEFELTYGEAVERVEELAGALLASGVGHGDRVAVYSPPHAQTLLIYLATASIGAIFTGLSPKQSVDEIERVIRDAEPRLLFFVGPLEDEHAGKLAELERRLEGGPKPELIAQEASAGRPWPAIHSLLRDRRASTAEHAAARRAIGPRDPVAMVYTSGSTGPARGALLVNGPMVRSYTIQADHWYDEPPVGVADLPIHHLGFVGDNCTSLLAGGGTIHIIERWTPERILELIERRRLTFWWTQTTMLLLASRSERWDATDFSSLRRIAFGGAPITEALRAKLVATGIPLGHGYGMTEVHGNATYVDNDAPIDVITGTVGRGDHRLEVIVADDEGRRCPIGTPGEILIRGETLFGGYRLADGTIDPARDADGWYHTADLGVERPDGNLELAGRKDDMFKSGGFNVYPRQIEQVLEGHEGVSVAAVIDIPDSTWSRVGQAYVLLAPGSRVDEETLRSYSRARLANYKVPKRFELRAELPMLPSGKVDKAALRREVGVG